MSDLLNNTAADSVYNYCSTHSRFSCHSFNYCPQFYCAGLIPSPLNTYNFPQHKLMCF